MCAKLQNFLLLFITFGVIKFKTLHLLTMKNIFTAISIRTLNGCVFLGTLIGRMHELDLLIYLTSIFSILIIGQLFCRKFHVGTYVYTFLMLSFYFILLIYTILS